MSAAAKYAPRYTTEDYRHWRGDWELWDGIAIAMTPSPFGPHQKILFALSRELSNALIASGCDATVLGELDWVVRDDTVVRPDVLVVCGDAPEKHLCTPPALIAEILSHSTRQNDLTYKRELYASERVGTYLIVDPEAGTIEHLRLANSGSYSQTTLNESLRVNVCNGCEIELRIDAIFR